MKYVISVLIFLILITGCTPKNYNSDNLVYKVNSHIVFDNLNSGINSLSNQLFLNITKEISNIENKIAITTFINNDDLKKTSTLGRSISENLINDLHIKGFKIIDLSSQKNISISKDGIFYLSRNQDELKEKRSEIFILVGTYSKLDYDSVAINARLLNYDTSEVISTAKIIYSNKDCSIMDLCKESKIKVIKD